MNDRIELKHVNIRLRRLAEANHHLEVALFNAYNNFIDAEDGYELEMFQSNLFTIKKAQEQINNDTVGLWRQVDEQLKEDRIRSPIEELADELFGETT